jgi:hypothetical protein
MGVLDCVDLLNGRCLDVFADLSSSQSPNLTNKFGFVTWISRTLPHSYVRKRQPATFQQGYYHTLLKPADAENTSFVIVLADLLPGEKGTMLAGHGIHVIAGTCKLPAYGSGEQSRITAMVVSFVIRPCV